jgi:hypothetical protein
MAFTGIPAPPETYKEGVLLFSRYAFVCAEEKLLRGDKRMSRWDFDWLKMIVEKKCQPNVVLLVYSFSNAHKSYQECQLCRESGFRADFSRQSVSYHWQNHHGHTGDCAVKIVPIVSVIDTTSNLAVVIDGKIVCLPNIYNLDLKKGDKVSLHKNLPIEKVDE